MPLLSLNGIKMIERLGLGAVYFQDYYSTNQRCVCVESLGYAEEGRDDTCGDSSACALVMKVRVGRRVNTSAPKVNQAKYTQHNNQQNRARDRDGMRFGMWAPLYNERATFNF